MAKKESAKPLPSNYRVEVNGLSVPVKIVEKPKEFVRIYELGLPKLGAGTKALMESVKAGLVAEVPVRAEKILDLKFFGMLKERFKAKAEELLAKQAPSLSEKEKATLIGLMLNDLVGLGVIEILLSDSNLEEIVINSVKEPVWVYHKSFGWLKTTVSLESEEQIANFANIIGRRVGKQITVLNPLLDAHLVTGDRANATLFPISSQGNTLTIRRFRREPWTAPDFIQNNTLSSEVMALLWFAVQFEANIIFSGGTASGKCVSADAEIILPTEIVKAKDLVEREFKKGKVLETEDGFVCFKPGLEVLSLNPANMNLEKAEVEAVWKRKTSEELIEVKTQTGRTVKTTPEHPFFILDNGFKKIRADELAQGSFIAAPRNLNVKAKNVFFEVSKLKGMKRCLGRHLEMRPNNRVKTWIKVPETLNENLARLIGYILGDGHIDKTSKHVKFFNKNEELLNDFLKCGEEVFGLRGRIRYPSSRTPYVEFASIIIGQFFSEVIGIPAGNKSASVRIPQPILFAKKALLREVIKTLFESEAFVSTAKGELEFSSSSKGLVKDVSFALFRFGVLNQTKFASARNRLFIGGKNLADFALKIGMISSQKIASLKKAKKNVFSSNIDFIPGIENTIKNLSKNLFLCQKEMKGELSREAISSYVCGRRKPTRTSLVEVVANLRKRFDELEQYKLELEEAESFVSRNERVFDLIKKIYRKINLTRKRLAQISGVSTKTILDWELGRHSPSNSLLDKLGQAVISEFDDYSQALDSDYSNSESEIKALRIKKTEIASRLHVHPFVLYPRFREKYGNQKKLEEIQQTLTELKDGMLCELNELNHEVRELKILLAMDGNILGKKIFSIRKKLHLPVQGSFEILFDDTKEKLFKAISNKTKAEIDFLDKLCNSDILWDKVLEVKKIKPRHKWVYDLTVDKNHTFLANNLIVHNTTMLNVCLPFVQANHRVVSIEETRELTLPDFLHWVPLTTREPSAEGKGGISMLDLLVNALRMRPDRIVLGEVRRQREIEVLFEAMHTGHSGYTTIHANTAEQTVRRITTPPISLPVSLLDIVHLNVVMFRNRRTGARNVLEIAEYIPEKRGLREEALVPNVLYKFKPALDKMVKHNESIRFFEDMSLHTGLSLNEIKKDLAEKQKILDWMVKQNIHRIEDVGRIIGDYYLDKKKVLSLMKKNAKPGFLK